MQRVLAAAAGLFAASIALPAASADLAAIPFTRESAAAAVIYDWSGLYTGINGGGGSVHSCWEVVSVLGIAAPTPISEGCHNAAGGTAGGQIGYRWQTSRWVFGLEAQGNWADFNASNVSLVLAPLTNRSRIGAFGLFTGQVGYTANNLLFYMKGGAAVAQAKYDTYVPAGPFTFNSVSETRWGGALGVGLEFGFAQNCTITSSSGITMPALRRRQVCSRTPIASARTSIWVWSASTTVGAARSSRSTDNNNCTWNTERPASRRPFVFGLSTADSATFRRMCGLAATALAAARK